jgi:hypothetical protein
MGNIYTAITDWKNTTVKMYDFTHLSDFDEIIKQITIAEKHNIDTNEPVFCAIKTIVFKHNHNKLSEKVLTHPPHASNYLFEMYPVCGQPKWVVQYDRWVRSNSPLSTHIEIENLNSFNKILVKAPFWKT